MQKFFSRFAIVYFICTTAPWNWFELPPFTTLAIPFHWVLEKLTTICNNYLWHIKPTLNQDGGGSGDTSYAWAEFFTVLLLSLLVAFLWGFFDTQSRAKRNYWTQTLVRFFVCFQAIAYGLIKMFGLQMPEPTLSRYATYFGDLLPMRLTWSYIGSSYPYEFFTGFLELTVGLLLLWRRTISLGVFIGMGVFLHVFMMNMCYDIPVKLFSFQLVICCMYLVYLERHNYLNFFILKRNNFENTNFKPYLDSKFFKIGRVVIKVFFIMYVIGGSIFMNLSWSNEDQAKAQLPHFKPDIYQIETYIKNGDTVATCSLNKWDWRDFIFEKGGVGSIKSIDSSLFRHRYGRIYFDYSLNPKNKTVEFRKTASDPQPVFTLNYIENDSTLTLKGTLKNNAVYWKLKATHTHFPLQDKPFHWISEANR